MKKIVFSILFFWTVTCAFGQIKRQFSLDWSQQNTYQIGNSEYKIPVFNSRNFEFNPVDGTILFQEVILDNQYINDKSVRVLNVVYEDIASKDLGVLSQKNIPNTLVYSVRNSFSRDEINNVVVCSPIINQSGQFKKVISFELEYELAPIPAFRFQKSNSITNSVLSSGDWYRFSVVKSGAYKITKSFLASMGVNTIGLSPQSVRVFGNGGRMLPLSNAENYPDDLQEVSVQIIGNQDAVFGEDEFILFYGEGVDNWDEKNQTHVNLFEDKSYYYVLINTGTSKQMSAISIPQEAATTQINTYDLHLYHEVDLINPARIGRKWFGESFTTNSSQNYSFSIPNYIPSEPCLIKVNALASSPVTTSLAVVVNGENLGGLTFSAVADASNVLATEVFYSTQYIPKSPDFTIALSYNNQGIPTSESYLDYVSVDTKCALNGYGKQFLFSNSSTIQNGTIAEYVLGNASAIRQIWDVTDIYNIATYTHDGQSSLSFKQRLNGLKKYVAIDYSDLYVPSLEVQSKVSTQNIKGTVFQDAKGDFQDVDYVIITPNAYLNQANRLADLHRVKSGLSVRVLTLNEIYHEFSSGKQDVAAIRNAIKYIYTNASDTSKRLKYVCLFGGASFDYKNRIPNNTNIVPVFHANNGYSLVRTFMSDDFYGLMDYPEGEMLFYSGIDVAVGRILFKNSAEATTVVDKIINYENEASLGKWRNDILLVSDDVDAAWEDVIQKGVDDVGKVISTERPFVNVKKIHMDAYVQETSSGGNRYPEVRNEIKNQLEKGVLVFDYFGHGGEDGLAKERIFEKSDAQELKNKNKLPLVITATCEYSRFDNPYRPTAGELIYLNPNGGAIGLISTTRQIGVTTGLNFNNVLIESLYAYKKETYPSIGEALRLSKNKSANSGVTIISCIGDPALQLAIPKPKIVLTHFNDMPINQVKDTLKALSFVKFRGAVVDASESVLTGFNGDMNIDVFDKNIKTKTLGNDLTNDSSGKRIILDFEKLGEVVFRGSAKVENGLFEVSFVLPKDIRIPIGEARISMYGKDNKTANDYTGVELGLKIGGFNDKAPNDNKPPVVKLYMNSEIFISGGIVNKSPVLLAFLEDENGINTAGGVGHDIVAILDGNESNPINLNDFYTNNPNQYKSGKLAYTFSNLSEGMHTVEFRAWDVYNNRASQTIQFQVVGNQNLVLDKVLNYPNPFVNYTEFWFNHNKPNEPLEAQVQVFTVSGKLVKTINQTITNTGFLSRDLSWDGRDKFGERIGKGVYVYKLKVKSIITGQQAQKTEKLVVF